MRSEPRNSSARKHHAAAAVLASLLIALPPLPAEALSGVGSDDSPREQQPKEEPEVAPGLPLPDPLINRSPTDSAGTPEVGGEVDAAADAEIILDPALLPEPVRRMRELIVEAAASGDIEQLRPLTTGPHQTQVNGEINDPIEALKSYSGDPEGLEILAILLDILSTGAARLDVGTPDEVYVWPYFAGKTLSSLTAPERVDLLRIVTAGDLMGMEESGNYNFYRLAITPAGEWKSMTGGD
ncbi:hypothetical protein REJC140_03759 [Pseudorhizobium endolithicum]|uniref:Uncharacterized protein n=1 Tax=Pseudorhizobium endolithicum TaxID=1191678 RepID=A0ABN7JUK3_9HYPH|nr:hypothetical protein [Pseudorhizobium endolithicum]CAD6419926.1 hypothetical protein REQ54_02034 [Rhizobium sp. Q54]CAD7043954.1 hypothetical protein REJC140_03759 [Pseudorhizobium endolithicum]